ncbi:hypothetical protein [Streptomyces sp. NBC_00268]|uniref:hypothetical protein n=1 Tax=Streptomyces sp. NBC_00268 TaxID=2975695 RepID=UPI00224E06F7|nr:hypothetical protein [Streptomyces sp. NBC_00268]MCX5187410.1 hypothetical protein [Streptomyces sp. NBC_00268]
MANPTRDTTAGRVYNDLRNLARRNSRSTDEVMVEYTLERFLYRLASSPLGRRHFVLEVACCSPRSAHVERPATSTSSAAHSQAPKPRSSAGARPSQIDDGVAFDPTTLKTVPIREEDEADQAPRPT